MSVPKNVLQDWIIEYVKSKDLITKHITAIKPNEQNADVVIESTVKNQYIIVQPELVELKVPELLKDKHIVLVTTNTKENMEFLIAHWNEFLQYIHMSVYFVNPNSSLDKRWIIFPATHDRITEKRALRKGIESLFLTVEPLTT